MNCKGLIFDLDGTLLDTLEDLADAANKSLRSLGFPDHPVDAYRYFVGEGLQTLVRRILPDSAGAEDVERLVRRFGEVYSKNWNAKSAPYNGVLEMINTFAEAGLKLAVLSNKPHEFTVICVETFFPEHPFSFVYGKRDGIARKPDPAGALEIAEKMMLSVNDIIYVGDTATDMKTGNSAGMRTIGVEWGFRDRKELLENNAWKVVSTPAEVVDHAI